MSLFATNGTSRPDFDRAVQQVVTTRLPEACCRGETEFLLLEMPVRLVRRTLKQWARRQLPTERQMPDEGRWALAWLRANRRGFRIGRCGWNKKNWGIFVQVPYILGD